MIKAIIFDIDGVLLDSFDSNVAYLKDLLAAAGFRLTRKAYSHMYFLTMWDVIRKVTGFRSRKKIQKIHDISKTLPDLPEYFAKPTPYSLSVLKQLKARGYRIALVSNRTRENIIDDYFVTAPQIRRYIGPIIAFEDVRRHKPHPEALLLAAKRLKTPPEKCLYVGDASSDIQAARAAGMQIVTYGPRRLRKTVRHIRSFREFMPLLRTLHN